LGCLENYLIKRLPTLSSAFALVIEAVIIVTTIRLVLGPHCELLWPENVVYGQPLSGFTPVDEVAPRSVLEPTS